MKLEFLTISNYLLWVVLIIQTLFIFYLTKLIVNFLNRFRLVGNSIQEIRLEVGQEAPLFRSKNHLGEVVKLKDGSQRYTLLIFGSKSCSSCSEVIKNVSSQINNRNLRVFIIYNSDSVNEEVHPTEKVHHIYSSDIFENYYVSKVPHIFLIDPSGMIKVSKVIKHSSELLGIIREAESTNTIDYLVENH